MKKSSVSGLIVLSFIAFISLGMPDGLLGVAWPGIRKSFSLPVDALGLLLIFSTLGYTLSSFLSGTLVRLLGLGGLLSLSCAATASALFCYGITPVWWIFMLAATLGGLGAGAIDAGVNNYVARNHSERMMQWLHASFGIGITLGPIIMTGGLVSTGRWQWGYLVVATAQMTLGMAFFLTRRWWGTSSLEEEQRKADEAGMAETLAIPTVWLSMFMFFIYTGVELGLGVWAYSLLTESRHISPGIAGFITGSYWGMFTLGRFLAGWYSRLFSIKQILYFSIFLALLGTGMVLLNLSSWVTIAGIALTGIAIAPIFPGMVSDTENRVGRRFMGQTIGIQIAAAGIGGATVPSLAGVLARHFGLEVIPPYLLTALVLLLLSLPLSHKLKKKEKPEASPSDVIYPF